MPAFADFEGKFHFVRPFKISNRISAAQFEDTAKTSRTHFKMSFDKVYTFLIIYRCDSVYVI
jgi:hypothetical protein